jgi:flavorubredoxin
MTPEEIVKSLGEWGAGLSDVDAAIDLIERQAAEVSELSKTISQIWLQLGNPTYEELNGRSIHDLIDEIKAENKKLRETLELRVI